VCGGGGVPPNSTGSSCLLEALSLKATPKGSAHGGGAVSLEVAWGDGVGLGATVGHQQQRGSGARHPSNLDLERQMSRFLSPRLSPLSSRPLFHSLLPSLLRSLWRKLGISGEHSRPCDTRGATLQGGCQGELKQGQIS